MKRMKKTGGPLALTANGKAEAEHLDAIANIRQGLLEAQQGLGQSPKEVFAEIRRKTRSRK
jgi:hypothetical protein